MPLRGNAAYMGRGEAPSLAQKLTHFGVPSLVSLSASCASTNSVSKSRRISFLSKIETEKDDVAQNISESTKERTGCNITPCRCHARNWNGGGSIVLQQHLLLTFAFGQTGCSRIIWQAVA